MVPDLAHEITIALYLLMASPSHERKLIELNKTYGYLQNNEPQTEGFLKWI